MVLVLYSKSNVYAENWSFLMMYGCVYLRSRHGGGNKMYVINQYISKTCSAPFILISTYHMKIQIFKRGL
jgi:hypothetical protein